MKRFTIVLLLIIMAFAIIAIPYYVYKSLDTYAKYAIYTNETVHGMVISAPVEYRGVHVGEVTNIDVVDPDRIRILLKIKKSLPITVSTTATIIYRGLASSGFTGYVYIALNNLSVSAPPLTTDARENYPVITTLPEQQSSMDITIYDMKKDVDNISKIIESILDKETRASFKHLIQNMDKISDMLANNNQRLNQLIINTEKSSRHFSTLIDSGTKTFAIIQSQIMPEAYQVLTNLNALSSTMTDVADKLAQDPSVLLRGIKAPIRGPGEL